MTGIKVRHNSVDSSHHRRFNAKTYINDVKFSGRNTVHNVVIPPCYPCCLFVFQVDTVSCTEV